MYRHDVPHLADVICPQQENGYDCGVYTILYSRIIGHYYCNISCNSGQNSDITYTSLDSISQNDISQALFENIGSRTAHAFRTGIQNIIKVIGS